MCGRVRIKTRKPELEEEFRELHVQPDLKFLDSFNIPPSGTVHVIRQQADGSRTIEACTWGLRSAWTKSESEAQSIARADTVATRRTFKDAFQHRRCIIPIDGYYEWQTITRHIKQPWHVYRPDGGIVSLAGLWATWPGNDEEGPRDTCCIITVDPNQQLATVHDRMPVILSQSAYETWLDPNCVDPIRLQSLLQPCPADWLAFDPVSAYINNPKHDGPKCIEPVKLQRGLFD